MEGATREVTQVTDAASDQRVSNEQALGLRSARDGLQPVQDLSAFLAALPDFGEDADRLLAAIMANRAQRRREAEERNC